MERAPYFLDVSVGKAPEVCFWLKTQDNVRIRAAFWNSAKSRGTVFLFSGRTEYIEKYSDVALALTTRGYDVATLDWRGQGLSERLHENRWLGHLGHIDDFTAYQKDVAAFLTAVQQHNLSQPYFLLAHSMGGAIGLRALQQGLDVRAAMFSGPMWDIKMSKAMRPLAPVVAKVANVLGFGARFAPGQAQIKPQMPFEENPLTRDKAMFDWMEAQVLSHPELFLGGVSWRWLQAALEETAMLSRQPSSDIPALCWLGSEEKIVSPEAIRRRMADWPGGTLVELPGLRHELLMEDQDTRQKAYDEISDFFGQH